MAGFVTLNEIVRNALIDRGEETLHKAPQFLGWAKRAAKELMFDTPNTGNVREVRLPISAVKTVAFPDGMIDWIEFGVYVGEHLFPLAFNGKLESEKYRSSCGIPARRTARGSHLPDDTTELYYYGGYFFSGYGNHAHLARGRHLDYGYFNVDFTDQVFALSSEVPTTTAHLKYLCNGQEINGQTLVPEYAAEYINECINWQERRFDRSRRHWEIREAKEDHNNQKRLTKARLSGLTFDNLVRALQKGFYARKRYPKYIGSPMVDGQIERCTNPFGTEEEVTLKRFWGVSPQPVLDASGVEGLQFSENADSREATKVFDASGGNYLYYAYPIEWGQASVYVSGLFTTSIQTTASINTDSGPVDYYILRSLNLQNGSSITVEFQ